MNLASSMTHPNDNDIYLRERDLHYSRMLTSPGLHMWREEDPDRPGWFTLRYWRVVPVGDGSGAVHIEAWEGGTYPASWFRSDWAQFAWGPFGRQAKRPRRLQVVK